MLRTEAAGQSTSERESDSGKKQVGFGNVAKIQKV